MDKIKFIVFIYFIFILSIYGERIYLKNGAIIDGEILQQTMTTIQVRTYKGELKTINKDDIRRIDFKFDIRKEEERRKQEEQRRLEEERRRQEEQRRLEEERHKQEEQRLLKKINLFKLEHFLINQSIVSSGYYDVFPFSPYFPTEFEQFSSAPRVFPSRTKEKWNYGNFRFSIDLAFEHNRFLWVTYIPIISFFNITYKENLSLPNFSTVYSEADFEGNNPITGYFDPRILMGYRVIFDKNNSWNIYVGGEYYRIGVNLVDDNCRETILYSQKLLFLNCKVFDLTFNGAGPLFVAEYERWFKYLTLKVQFGLFFI